MAEKIAGINSIMEALRGPRKVHKIFIQEGKKGPRWDSLIRMAEKKGVFVQYIDKLRLDQMYKITNHQGVIAQVDDYIYADIDQILQLAEARQEPALILILDGIEDPQNLGTIIRSSECAGVHGIVIPRHNSTEITAAVMRASAGAAEHMLIARETNLVNTIKYLKKRDFWIIGADPQASMNYFDLSLTTHAAVVLGGENQGIRRLVQENCDFLVKIPINGKINSLNASVAGAIIIYDLIRQRNYP